MSSHENHLCSWLGSNNIAIFIVGMAAAFKSNMAVTRDKFCVAQYLKMFVSYF